MASKGQHPVGQSCLGWVKEAYDKTIEKGRGNGKATNVKGVKESWEVMGFALNFFEDTRLLPVQQKLLRSLAGNLLKANAPNDESEIRPQTGTRGQSPRG